MAKLVWRVKPVAELEPGAVTETELARIERDQRASMAELGSRLDEAKRLTAALQAEIVPAQMAALGACRRACEACGRMLAARGHSGATFRSLFGAVPVRVRRWFVCPCQGASEAKSVAALAFGGDGVAPELAYVTARYRGQGHRRRWRPAPLRLHAHGPDRHGRGIPAALAAVGVDANTPATVLCDGDAGLWRLQREVLPNATVVLD